MSNTEATINLFEEIPLLLSVSDKDGNQVPGAVIYGVVWNQDTVLGTIIPNPADPSKAIFKPSVAGITHISATAVVTVP